MDEVHAKLTELNALVEGARALPMSASCVVNRSDLLGLLADLESLLPDTISRAQEVLGDKQGVLEEGRREAEQIIAAMRLDVIVSSCGMYSTQAALGTAAVSDTCNSIRKCGQIGTLNDSARCATFSHGVMPPIRATSACTIEQASRCRYSRKCCSE